MVLHSRGCGRVARRRFKRIGPPGRAFGSREAPFLSSPPGPVSRPGLRSGNPHFLSLNTSRAQAFYRNGFIDWATMHYFVPKRCTESNKIMYHDKATAQQAADQSWRERGTELWVYRCGFCGTWHLTHRDPQSSYMHVPLNQQLKPHSRKKGYKPRRR